MRFDIGFTGSQVGMNATQNLAILDHLKDKQTLSGYETYIHHGDCIGADAGFDIIAKIIDIPTIIHPPENPHKRAFCDGYFEIREPKPYLDRNKDIVDESDILIVCPNTMHESLRSGTWSTWRYAKKTGKPWIIFFPDGTVEKWQS